MGLNCGCPAGAHIPDLSIPDCKESMGQIQKILIQRRFKTPGVLNTIDDPTKKASFTPLFSAADSTKMVVTPYIQAPTSEPGAARTFGGGNQTLGGIPIIIGSEPTTMEAMFYQESQATIATMKKYMCEDVVVWLIDEYGNLGCLADNPSQPTKYSGVPIMSLFIGDKKLGGLEEVDSNTISWSFHPNWSDNLVVIKRDTLDFNPLTDFVNVASGIGG